MRILGRRIVFYLITALAAITVGFFIPRMMPGNPVEAILAHLQGQISASTVKSLAVQFGVQTKEGLLGQYLHYLNNILHGNFGISTSYYPSSVSSVIKGALPWTLGLVGVATIISFVLGTLVGVLVAWRRGSWLDNLLPAMTFFQAAPYFFIAFLALELFAARLGWFPTGRAYNQLDFPALTFPFAGDVLSHAALPALTIVVCSAAGWIVGMRNVMVTTMDEDYVLVAQAKGLGKRRVVWYAARNACCRASPASPSRSASSCPGRCSPRSCSATRAWAGSCCRRSTTATTRCSRGSSSSSRSPSWPRTWPRTSFT